MLTDILCAWCSLPRVAALGETSRIGVRRGLSAPGPAIEAPARRGKQRLTGVETQHPLASRAGGGAFKPRGLPELPGAARNSQVGASGPTGASRPVRPWRTRAVSQAGDLGEFRCSAQALAGVHQRRVSGTPWRLLRSVRSPCTRIANRDCGDAIAARADGRAPHIGVGVDRADA
jgi:hypothetical protein